MYKKNIYPTNPCPETPGKTLLNTNVPSTKMLNPKNTFNLFSKYKKYPSNLFIIQKISFTDFSRCLSFFFKIPKIPFTFFHYNTNTFTQIEAVPPCTYISFAGIYFLGFLFCAGVHLVLMA